MRIVALVVCLVCASSMARAHIMSQDECAKMSTTMQYVAEIRDGNHKGWNELKKHIMIAVVASVGQKGNVIQDRDDIAIFKTFLEFIGTDLDPPEKIAKDVMYACTRVMTELRAQKIKLLLRTT